MASAALFGGHAAHLVIFGLPVAGLVGAVVVQEVQAHWRSRQNAAEGGPNAAGADAPSRDARRSLPLQAAVYGLLVAAAVHGSIIRDHFHEYVLYGAFFSVLTVGQGAIAVVLSRRPTARLVRSVAIGSALVVVLWFVSRTSGLPIGPEAWHPEALGLTDLAATIAEAATCAGCVVHLRSASRSRRRVPRPSLEMAR